MTSLGLFLSVSLPHCCLPWGLPSQCQCQTPEAVQKSTSILLCHHKKPFVPARKKTKVGKIKPQLPAQRRCATQQVQPQLSCLPKAAGGREYSRGRPAACGLTPLPTRSQATRFHSFNRDHKLAVPNLPPRSEIINLL